MARSSVNELRIPPEAEVAPALNKDRASPAGAADTALVPSTVTSVIAESVTPRRRSKFRSVFKARSTLSSCILANAHGITYCPQGFLLKETQYDGIPFAGAETVHCFVQ